MRSLNTVWTVRSVAVCFILCGHSNARSQDWPMWRADAQRSAASDHTLPDEMSLHWTRQLAPPAPAWPPEQDYHEKLEFDVADQAVASRGKLFVPSSARDSLTAFSIESGEELWRFYGSGPTGAIVAIELPGDGGKGRIAWEGKVDGKIRGMLAASGHLVVTTEEGRLYCFGESSDRDVVNHTPEQTSLEARRGCRTDPRSLSAVAAPDRSVQCPIAP